MRGETSSSKFSCHWISTFGMSLRMLVSTVAMTPCSHLLLQGDCEWSRHRKQGVYFLRSPGDSSGDGRAAVSYSFTFDPSLGDVTMDFSIESQWCGAIADWTLNAAFLPNFGCIFNICASAGIVLLFSQILQVVHVIITQYLKNCIVIVITLKCWKMKTVVIQSVQYVLSYYRKKKGELYWSRDGWRFCKLPGLSSSKAKCVIEMFYKLLYLVFG